MHSLSKTQVYKTVIGVLALQGDFQLHSKVLQNLGCKTLEIRKTEELSNIDALIIPGGESSTFLKLLNKEFAREIKTRSKKGFPIFATCAGLIILATKIHNPQEREGLGVLPITVERNTYGRQNDSFIDEIDLIPEFYDQLKDLIPQTSIAIRGVFIRAPSIKNTNCSILAKYKNQPVLIKQNNILASTFHPEVSGDKDHILHKYFLNICSKNLAI